ncbi:MAG: WD40 repeat domain-containing protein [Microscillaceae bacterium]|nr:WD40 repeat domain-containing protein [Microscillaceae bacterium]MDW8460534.1 WD40 repeat domain-containing protein [Cytophagales bacterium]
MLKRPILVNKTAILAGHQDCVYALEIGRTPYEIFSADGSGSVAIWDLRTPDLGKLLAKLPNSVYALCYWRERNILIIGQNFEGLHFIDLTLHRQVGSIKLTSQAIFDIKIYQNLAWVACGDGVLIIVDLPNMAVKKHIKASEKSARCIDIHAERQQVAVGYSDNAIRIFGLNDFLPLANLPNSHLNSVFCVKYAPKGNFLLSSSRDARLKIWDIDNNFALHQEIVAHLYALNHIAFSPDGENFATCSMDKTIKIWDSYTFQLLKVIDRARHAGHGTSVNKLVWTSYENLLLSASDDRMVSVWQLTQGQATKNAEFAQT